MQTAALLELGNRAFSQGQYTRALHCYQRALEEVRGDPTLLADIYGNLGNVHGAGGQTEQAVGYYHKALELLRRQEDYGRLGTTFVNIGNLYADQGDHGQATHFYAQGALLLEREEKWDELATLYSNRSLLSLNAPDLPSALDYAKQAVAYAGRRRRSACLAESLHRLAKATGAIGDLREAQRLSETSYGFYVQVQDDMGCAMTLYHQASLYEAKQDWEAAIRCLEQVVAIDTKYGLPKLSENTARLAALRTKLTSS